MFRRVAQELFLHHSVSFTQNGYIKYMATGDTATLELSIWIPGRRKNFPASAKHNRIESALNNSITNFIGCTCPIFKILPLSVYTGTLSTQDTQLSSHLFLYIIGRYWQWHLRVNISRLANNVLQFCNCSQTSQKQSCPNHHKEEVYKYT